MKEARARGISFLLSWDSIQLRSRSEHGDFTLVDWDPVLPSSPFDFDFDAEFVLGDFFNGLDETIQEHGDGGTSFDDADLLEAIEVVCGTDVQPTQLAMSVVGLSL